MLCGEGSTKATPLVAFLAEAGARLDGLRLLGGTREGDSVCPMRASIST